MDQEQTPPREQLEVVAELAVKLFRGWSILDPRFPTTRLAEHKEDLENLKQALFDAGYSWEEFT